MELTSLERAVLDLLLAGEHPVLAALRAQAAVCTVTTRDRSGVGFFTSFQVPSNAPRHRLSRRVPPLGNVLADFPGTAHGAGFLLYIEDGALAALEGYTFDDPWPDDTSAFSLRSDPQALTALAALGLVETGR